MNNFLFYSLIYLIFIAIIIFLYLKYIEHLKYNQKIKEIFSSTNYCSRYTKCIDCLVNNNKNENDNSKICYWSRATNKCLSKKYVTDNPRYCKDYYKQGEKCKTMDVLISRELIKTNYNGKHKADNCDLCRYQKRQENCKECLKAASYNSNRYNCDWIVENPKNNRCINKDQIEKKTYTDINGKVEKKTVINSVDKCKKCSGINKENLLEPLKCSDCKQLDNSKCVEKQFYNNEYGFNCIGYDVDPVNFNYNYFRKYINMENKNRKEYIFKCCNKQHNLYNKCKLKNPKLQDCDKELDIHKDIYKFSLCTDLNKIKKGIYKNICNYPDKQTSCKKCLQGSNCIWLPENDANQKCKPKYLFYNRNDLIDISIDKNGQLVTNKKDILGVNYYKTYNESTNTISDLYNVLINIDKDRIKLDNNIFKDKKDGNSFDNKGIVTFTVKSKQYFIKNLIQIIDNKEEYIFKKGIKVNLTYTQTAQESNNFLSFTIDNEKFSKIVEIYNNKDFSGDPEALIINKNEVVSYIVPDNEKYIPININSKKVYIENMLLYNNISDKIMYSNNKDCLDFMNKDCILKCQKNIKFHDKNNNFIVDKLMYKYECTCFNKVPLMKGKNIFIKNDGEFYFDNYKFNLITDYNKKKDIPLKNGKYKLISNIIKPKSLGDNIYKVTLEDDFGGSLECRFIDSKNLDKVTLNDNIYKLINNKYFIVGKNTNCSDKKSSTHPDKVIKIKHLLKKQCCDENQINGYSDYKKCLNFYKRCNNCCNKINYHFNKANKNINLIQIISLPYINSVSGIKLNIRKNIISSEDKFNTKPNLEDFIFTKYFYFRKEKELTSNIQIPFISEDDFKYKDIVEIHKNKINIIKNITPQSLQDNWDNYFNNSSPFWWIKVNNGTLTAWFKNFIKIDKNDNSYKYWYKNNEDKIIEDLKNKKIFTNKKENRFSNNIVNLSTLDNISNIYIDRGFPIIKKNNLYLKNNDKVQFNIELGCLIKNNDYSEFLFLKQNFIKSCRDNSRSWDLNYYPKTNIVYIVKQIDNKDNKCINYLNIEKDKIILIGDDKIIFNSVLYNNYNNNDNPINKDIAIYTKKKYDEIPNIVKITDYDQMFINSNDDNEYDIPVDKNTNFYLNQNLVLTNVKYISSGVSGTLYGKCYFKNIDPFKIINIKNNKDKYYLTADDWFKLGNRWFKNNNNVLHYGNNFIKNMDWLYPIKKYTTHDKLINRFDIKEINNLGLQEIIFSKKRDHLDDYLSYNSNYIFKDTINFADLKLYDIKITEIDSTPIKINSELVDNHIIKITIDKNVYYTYNRKYNSHAISKVVYNKYTLPYNKVYISNIYLTSKNKPNFEQNITAKFYSEKSIKSKYVLVDFKFKDIIEIHQHNNLNLDEKIKIIKNINLQELSTRWNRYFINSNKYWWIKVSNKKGTGWFRNYFNDYLTFRNPIDIEWYLKCKNDNPNNYDCSKCCNSQTLGSCRFELDDDYVNCFSSLDKGYQIKKCSNNDL